MDDYDFTDIKRTRHSRKELDLTNLNLKAYQWLREAEIYNQKFEQVASKWIISHSDIIILLFNVDNLDWNGVIKRFYTLYEVAKSENIPMEVIYIPVEAANEEEMKNQFAEQANWFALKWDDPLILDLKYFYEVTCVPQIRVIAARDCKLISRNGLSDIEQYGKNAFIAWLPKSVKSKMSKRHIRKELTLYGPKWKYLKKSEYHERLSPKVEVSKPKAAPKVTEEPRQTTEDQVISG